MPRISPQKKEETKRKILMISKKRFTENGYNQTSIKQIAADACIAEGTLFNYFPTKADLFFQAIDKDDFRTSDIEFRQYDSTLDVTDILMQYIHHKTVKILSMPKKVLIELGTALLGDAILKADIVDSLVQIDRDHIEHLVEFILYLQSRGMIRSCDAKVFGECIFDIVFMEFFIYLNMQERTLDEVYAKIREKLAAVLTGFRPVQQVNPST